MVVHQRRDSVPCSFPSARRRGSSASKSPQGPAAALSGKGDVGVYLSALLFASYLSIQLIRQPMLSVGLAAAPTDPSLAAASGGGLPKEAVANMMSLAALATMASKLILGPITDRVGGANMLLACCASMVTANAVIAIASSPGVFAGGWIVNEFFYGGGWAACISIVCANYEPSERTTKIGMLSSASRVGAMGGALLCGLLVSPQFDFAWRSVFHVVVALCFVPVAWLYASLGEIRTASSGGGGEEGGSSSSLPAMILRCFASLQFWLMLTNIVMLQLVQTFLGSFIAVYLMGAFHAPASSAASLASSFAFGSFVTSFFGIRVYSAATPRRKVALQGLSGVVVALCCALLWVRESGSEPFFTDLRAAGAIFTVLGMAIVLPFYIPPATFAMDFGGASNAALVSNLLESVGYLAAAAFTGRLAEGDWTTLTRDIMFASIISFAALMTFMLRDLKKEAKMKDK